MLIATFFFPSRIGVTSIISVGRFMLGALEESKKPAKHNCTKLLQIRPYDGYYVQLRPDVTLWEFNYENSTV